jgi:hypothetical protein
MWQIFQATLQLRGVVVAVIVWDLDLQLPSQSVPITTDVVSSNLDQGEVYNIAYYLFSKGVICQLSIKTQYHNKNKIRTQIWISFSQGPPLIFHNLQKSTETVL